jgi:hypothetical protein
MFQLNVSNMSLDSELQIIQADVMLKIEGTQVIDETLCIDAGLPALLRSVLYDMTPNRWDSEGMWEKVPFFVCGCGDADCKAFSFIIHHLDDDQVEIAEIEERQDNEPRIYDRWVIPKREYEGQILKVAEQFLDYVKVLDYRPLLTETVEIVNNLVNEINSR